MADSGALTPEKAPIRVTGVVTHQVGQPKKDGTPGSALYSVPLQLSERVTPAWAAIFVKVWDNPPSCTTMHRPRTASVAGAVLTLSETTLEEVRDVHLKTIEICIAETERRFAEAEAKRLADRDAQIRAAEEHKRHVEDIAGDIAKRLRGAPPEETGSH